MKLRQLISGILLAYGLQGCIMEPEGVQVKKEADGVLTAVEKEKVFNFLSSDEKLNDFSENMRDYLNDYNVFLDNEARDSGINGVRFKDDLHLYLGDDEYLNSIYSGQRESTPSAFYKRRNSTIYMHTAAFTPSLFIPTFYHEFGHSLRDNVVEFTSMANETYSLLKGIAFDNQIGSIFIADSLSSLSSCRNYADRRYTEGEDYEIAYLSFLVNATKSNGHLEKALETTRISPFLYLMGTGLNSWQRHGNLCDARFMEFQALLNTSEFNNFLNDYLDDTGVSELKSYLSLANLEKKQRQKARNGLISSAEHLDSVISAAEDFLSAGYPNPYFHANVASMLIDAYSSSIYNLAGDYSTEGISKSFEFAEKIIVLDNKLNCNFHPFYCNGKIAFPREQAVSSYYNALVNSSQLFDDGIKDYASLMQIPELFIAKYYPSGDYRQEANNLVSAKYLPKIAFLAGSFEKYLALLSHMQGDNAGILMHSCNELNWLKIVIDSSCGRITDDAIREECRGNISDTFENAARLYIESDLNNCRIENIDII